MRRKVRRFPNSVGISPLKLLRDKSLLEKEGYEMRTNTIELQILRKTYSLYDKLTRFPNSDGIAPVKLFLFKSLFEKEKESFKI